MIPKYKKSSLKQQGIKNVHNFVLSLPSVVFRVYYTKHVSW